MIIRIALTREQTKAIEAVAKLAHLSETEALIACAFIAIGTGYDDRADFRSHVLEVCEYIGDGRAAEFDEDRRMPCGVILN